MQSTEKKNRCQILGSRTRARWDLQIPAVPGNLNERGGVPCAFHRPQDENRPFRGKQSVKLHPTPGFIQARPSTLSSRRFRFKTVNVPPIEGKSPPDGCSERILHSFYRRIRWPGIRPLPKRQGTWPRRGLHHPWCSAAEAAGRKAGLPLELPGLFQLRLPQVQFSASLFQLPPRFTRLSPASAEVHSLSRASQWQAAAPRDCFAFTIIGKFAATCHSPSARRQCTTRILPFFARLH